LLAQGRWFSPGTSASSTTKTGRHDIAESGVKTPKIKSNLINKKHNFYRGLSKIKFRSNWPSDFREEIRM
jgi:hypothetical protein